VILRELRRRRRHASAEEIGTAVGRELPGISVPTVYATLDLFVELGLARKVNVGTGASLFDGRTDPHQHTVCEACGRVDDLDGPFESTAMAKARAQGLRYRPCRRRTSRAVRRLPRDAPLDATWQGARPMIITTVAVGPSNPWGPPAHLTERHATCLRSLPAPRRQQGRVGIAAAGC
jgi:Fe2+ or Zn2+ uptake regulation protein